MCISDISIVLIVLRVADIIFVETENFTMIKLQAHKGVSTEYPENTMPAYVAAIEQGYSVIELDVSVTKDKQFVMLHDGKINRTARNKDGSIIDKQINISDITYAEALKYDYGVWFSEKFKETEIPLFEDVLKLAAKSGIKIKIDNKYQHFSQGEKNDFYELLKPYETVAGLTCYSIEAITQAAEILKDMEFHYDGPVNEEILKQLSDIIPNEKLIVWLPYKNAHTSWVKVPFVDEASAAMVKKYSRLGIWLLSDCAELEEAERLGAEFAETNGDLKPVR